MNLNSSTGGGLLATARYRKEQHFLEDASVSLHNAFSDLPKTIDAPAMLFSSFALSYQVEKGALLLSGIEKESLIHVASIGFDLTTIRRLRIPESLFSFSDPQILEKNGVHDLRPYFSTREFSILDRVLIIPGFHGGLLSALMLISHGPEALFHSVPPFPQEFLSALADSSIGIDNQKSSIQWTMEEAEKLFLEMLDEHKQLSTALVNCASLLDFLKNKHPQGNPFSLLHRGITFTASQLQKSLQVIRLIQLSETEVLFIMPATSPSKAGALIHQAMLSLRSRFGSLKEIPQIEISRKTAPEDGALLSELFPSLV
jgi:hypothetical protein